MERQMCDGYVGAFAALADAPDRELRAELVGALLLGIAVQRSLVRTPALAEASAERVEPLCTAAVEALLHGRGVRWSSLLGTSSRSRVYRFRRHVWSKRIRTLGLCQGPVDDDRS